MGGKKIDTLICLWNALIKSYYTSTRDDANTMATRWCRSFGCRNHIEHSVYDYHVWTTPPVCDRHLRWYVCGQPGSGAIAKPLVKIRGSEYFKWWKCSHCHHVSDTTEICCSNCLCHGSASVHFGGLRNPCKKPGCKSTSKCAGERSYCDDHMHMANYGNIIDERGVVRYRCPGCETPTYTPDASGLCTKHRENLLITRWYLKR